MIEGKQALTIEQLRNNLHGEKAFHFTFKKKDGTQRKAVGTLNENLIPKEHQIIDDPSTGKAKESANFRYYDLEKCGWRSVSADTKEVTI